MSKREPDNPASKWPLSLGGEPLLRARPRARLNLLQSQFPVRQDRRGAK